MSKLKIYIPILAIVGACLAYLLALRGGLHDYHLPHTPGHASVLPFDELTHLHSKEVDESSGVALSERYPNAVWTHNDSGGKPYLYLVSTKTGKLLIRVMLEGAKNHDWEDLAYLKTDEGNYIVIGDIGDNYKIRRTCRLFFVPEPTVDLVEEAVVTLKLTTSDYKTHPFRFEQGAMNCESVAFDPESNSFILIQKLTSRQKGKSIVYQLELPQIKSAQSKVPTAKMIGEIAGSNYSSMDISKDGQKMVLRVYNSAYFIHKTAKQTWQQALGQPLPKWHRIPAQLQGEGVCFYPDGKHVLISSEKMDSRLIRVALPK